LHHTQPPGASALVNNCDSHLPGQSFLTMLDGAVTRRHRHWAELPTVLALLAEFRPYAEWEIDMPILTGADEANRP
jgi:hypothetical protein